MANFNTHFNIATAATGIASAALLSAGHADINTALWLWCLGTIGGLLPDIDSDNSTSLNIIFNIFSAVIILMVLRYITGEHFREIRFIELLVIPLGVYGIMKWLIRPLFEKVTVHRGSCHSLLFLTLCGLLTTQLTWIFNSEYATQSAIVALLSGGFVFFGGLIHLTLDEIYSVDLSNIRIKRSFGTALKIADFKNKSATFLMLVASIALGYMLPETDTTINLLTNWSTFKFY
ncbi:LexA-binding, inner membrane-associated putative hydrolase [Neptunomonas antarctica]|uniref:LexA-binding, inner membrane-associated putative hydrolase n=2 Tax=Neptunomonas antarctica TaxID=619304 RepID=A0A1N7LPF5_9GAMM|nr:LexA-binding, inner membrane-associated putative hydrolase [Neptunomonas antarctica]